jgi:histidyl-tRNA synthetase
LPPDASAGTNARSEALRTEMAEKPKKPQKLKARLPRGLEDRGPAAIAATRAMVEKIREVFERYGFEPVETPAFEYTDALGKFLPDQDRPNEGVFSFQDDDEQWISLRYDLTAPLARYVAERYGTENLVLPYRSYRFGWVFRNEKPGPGRFRQFMQFDADTVGSGSMAADAEICMMAADTMEKLGVTRGAYVVKVNNRKLLDGILEANGLVGEEFEAKRLIVLRAIDKFDRLGPIGVRQLLGEGRKDVSGDFTRGADLSSDQIASIMQFVEWKKISDAYFLSKYDSAGLASNAEVIEALRSFFGKNKTSNEGLDELELIARLVDVSDYKDCVRIDPTVVRGLEYYTGPVYEIEIYIRDSNNQPVSFGSVGGGGRYDGLVSRFRGEPVPATGFSIGVSRLQVALNTIPQFQTTEPVFGPVVVTVFDRDRVADYQRMVASLRRANIRAELYLGNPKNMGNQLKYADRRNSPCVIIQGSDEKARGEVQIKDLIEGAKAAAAIASNQEWRETRPAQFSCKEDEIVARVREVLARHDVKWG